MSPLKADLLIFAPHPDDEAIGAGGIIQHALASGMAVGVVFVTGGDGYPRAASALLDRPITDLNASDYVSLAGARQHEAVAAAELLGLRSSSLLFLGYPDGELNAVLANESRSPVESPFTGRDSTYGPAYADYHTLAHGQPAMYSRTSALEDVVEILRDSRPSQIYVTDGADTHPDHVATFNLVTDAMARTGYTGKLLTFLVHSGPTEGWPWPRGASSDTKFEQHEIDGTTFPIRAQWPPTIRVPLTSSECALKLEAIAAHRSQYTIDQEYMESFVKSEEVFWRPRL